MENIIMYAVIGVICPLVMTYLNKNAATKMNPIEGDAFQLRLNKLYLYLGAGSIFLGVVGLLWLGLTVKDGSGWLIGLILLIFLGGIGTVLMFWYVNHIFYFDSTKIEATNVYGNKTTLKWDEIISIKFSALSGLLIFADKNGKKVKAHQHLVGMSELLAAIENNTDWKIKDLKLPY